MRCPVRNRNSLCTIDHRTHLDDFYCEKGNCRVKTVQFPFFSPKSKPFLDFTRKKCYAFKRCIVKGMFVKKYSLFYWLILFKGGKMMYFGSAKFFKHLILTTVALLILTPTVISVVFGLKSRTLTRELITVQALAEASNTQLTELQLQNDKLEEERANSKIPKNEPLPANGDSEGNPIAYQSLFPDMTAPAVTKKDTGNKKIIYLTFDDGPSKKTIDVLNLLDLYEIKATFFVVYKDDEFSNSVYQEIVNRGHTLGIHSASHDYKKIYESVDAYLSDFNKMYEHIVKLTGYKPTLFRFPGGSINSYNSGIYMEIISEMTRRGFTYHDWNVSAQDASDKATEKSIYDMVVNAALKHNKSIVLMHDSANREATVKALPRIIDELYAKGYAFDKLSETVNPFLFSYNKPF